MGFIRPTSFHIKNARGSFMANDYHGFTFVIPSEAYPDSVEEACEYFNESSCATAFCSRTPWMQDALEKLVSAEEFPELIYISHEYAVLRDDAIDDAIRALSDLLTILANDPIRIAPAFDLDAQYVVESRVFICDHVMRGIESELILPDCGDGSEGYASYITLIRYMRGHLICLELAAKTNSKIACGWPC